MKTKSGMDRDMAFARDAGIGEILRRLAVDTTGLAAAVERGLDEQLRELNIAGLGEVDRYHSDGGPVMVGMIHDACLGRVAAKLSLLGTDYIRQSLDLVREETAEQQAISA